MYCRKCGAQIEDNDFYCPYCGEMTNSSQPSNTQTNNNVGGYNQPSNNTNNAQYNVSKTGIGVIMLLFLGFLGLIIGVLMYPAGTYARKSFVKGWVITWVVCLAITIGMCLFFLVMSY